jgi:GrpB-like predicted nucleotidyltransferase (UPF0157 family)
VSGPVLSDGEISPVTYSDVLVVEYDCEWPARFEELRSVVWPAVEGIALRIDHVGSTAVPGLAAKPIIDIDVVVPRQEDVSPAIEMVERASYRWDGDLGVRGREAFSYEGESPRPSHHLYLVVENNRAHLDHWLLRDLLRDDEDARRHYAALKRRNAEECAGDIEVYVRAKAWLVAELLARARAERGLESVEYWQPEEAPRA